MARPKTEKRANGGANLGFEQTLWQAVDKLRGHMDAFLGCHPELVEGPPTSGADSIHRHLHKHLNSLQQTA
ncbi:MAG TPA: hypothetical protein VL171_09195 [Verrucomicrobiae bacterium]|nr:hypothetical protein [Verrucomicrobiae bacterium]